MNIRALVGLLFLAVMVLILGIGIGILVGENKTAPSEVQNQVMSNAVKLLSSKVVPSVLARGTVTKIEGMNITLMYQTDSQPVTIKGDANISALILDPKAPANKPKYTTVAATFGDIEVNNNLEIAIKVLGDGTIEGFNVLILPPPSIPPAPASK